MDVRALHERYCPTDKHREHITLHHIHTILSGTETTSELCLCFTYVYLYCYTTLSFRTWSKINFRGNLDYLKCLKKERNKIIQASNKVHIKKIKNRLLFWYFGLFTFLFFHTKSSLLLHMYYDLGKCGIVQVQSPNRQSSVNH